MFELTVKAFDKFISYLSYVWPDSFYKKVIVLIKNDTPQRHLIINVGGVTTKEKLVSTSRHNTSRSFDSGVKLSFPTPTFFCLLIFYTPLPRHNNFIYDCLFNKLNTWKLLFCKHFLWTTKLFLATPSY